MVRTILGVVAGIVVAFVVIAVCEAIGHLIWHPPENVDMHDPEAVRRVMAQMPLGALVGVIVAWAAGTALGGWVAARLSRRAVGAYVVGGLVLAASLAIMIVIPHPLWFRATAVVALAVATFVGARLGTP